MYTAHYPRLHPSDFKVRTLDGVADDWPIDYTCLLYTSDAADERSSVDLGGRRIIKKKHNINDGHCLAV